MEGIYVHIDKCVKEDLPEDETCYSEDQFSKFMTNKVLKIIVKQNFIEKESYEILTSHSVKTVKLLTPWVRKEPKSSVPFIKLNHSELHYNDDLFAFFDLSSNLE